MRTSNIRNIAPVKGVIGKKRIADLKKAIKNRDARLTRWTKKLKGSDATIDDYKKLARAQYLPGKISVDFSKITSIKDYNALMRMLNADKTAAWKENRTTAMRRWLTLAIEKTLWIDRKTDPELFAIVDRMSDIDIWRFSNANKGLIHDIFEHYKKVIEAVERQALYDQIREAMGLSKKDLPDTLVF